MKLDLNQLRPINFNSKIFKQNKIIAKNVSNGSGNKKVEKCPICKSSKRRPYQTKYDIPIYICLKCDVGYAGLQPKNLNEVYWIKTNKNKELIKDFNKINNYKKKIQN